MTPDAATRRPPGAAGATALLLGPFQGLPEGSRSAVSGVAVLRRFSPGDHLARHGQPATHLAVIQRGAVSVDALGADGRPLTLDLAGPDAVVGETALLGPPVWESDIVALRAGSAAFFSIPHLQRLRNAEPAVAALTDELLATRIQRLTERLVETSHVPLRARLRLLLHRLDAFFAPGPIRLTHEQLARMLGTNRSTVSELLSAESRLGLVATQRGAISVLDATVLRDAALPHADHLARPS